MSGRFGRYLRAPVPRSGASRRSASQAQAASLLPLLMLTCIPMNNIGPDLANMDQIEPMSVGRCAEPTRQTSGHEAGHAPRRVARLPLLPEASPTREPPGCPGRGALNASTSDGGGNSAALVAGDARAGCMARRLAPDAQKGSLHTHCSCEGRYVEAPSKNGKPFCTARLLWPTSEMLGLHNMARGVKCPWDKIMLRSKHVVMGKHDENKQRRT